MRVFERSEKNSLLISLLLGISPVRFSLATGNWPLFGRRNGVRTV